jgi:hypothetical protein
MRPPQNTKRVASRSLPPFCCLLLKYWLGTGGGEGAADFSENGLNLRSDTRHDCTSGDGDETGHQSILDQILSASVFHQSEFPDKLHYFSLPATFLIELQQLPNDSTIVWVWLRLAQLPSQPSKSTEVSGAQMG